jgi:hypothetical protein
MEVRVEKKGQQPKKIDCSRMLVNAGHPMDKKANWCSHGGWFTLAGSLFLCTDDQLASYIKGYLDCQTTQTTSTNWCWNQLALSKRVHKTLGRHGLFAQLWHSPLPRIKYLEKL